MNYEGELARVSAKIEMTREELKRCLADGDDPTDAHETLDRLIGERYLLALSENWHDHKAAAADCDRAQAVAQEVARAVG